jgi:hypothetical protein
VGSDGNLHCADSKLFDYFLMAGQTLLDLKCVGDVLEMC